MNILIVDDRPCNLKLLRAVLEAEGTTVCEAADGVEALGMLQREPVDAIISDILMPRMDGYRLCMEVRAHRQFCDLPFIAYTATYTSIRDEKVMTDMGADRFLRKPASAAVLTATVEDVVRSKRRGPPGAAVTRPEVDLLNRYSERLVAKLEERNAAREGKIALPRPGGDELESAPGKSPRFPDHREQRPKEPAVAVERHEMGERKNARAWLALHHAVTVALRKAAASISEINKTTLATLGNGLNADFGELWMIEPGSQALHCTETWHGQSTGFTAPSKHLTFTKGKGLPGLVWESGQTKWRTNDAQPPLHASQHHASPSDFCAWIGFPIKLGEETVGVVGFFSHERTRPDEELLALLDIIGLQWGQLVERHQFADRLRQSQKMESIGTLTIGIAHDFNNILAGIHGYCELARMEVLDNACATAHLEGVISASRRATDLVQQILEFSRGEDQERQPLQLAHITTEALRLLRGSVSAKVIFQTSLGTDVPVVLANATQVHQILMNLGANAAYAMREHGGRLTVNLEDCHIDTRQAAANPELSAGRYARLTVIDTGAGMDAQTLSRIYEPLFTTKPPGQGTGIGLAVVRGIVKSHEGAIVVSSRCGEGTTFHVYFPAFPAAAREPARGSSHVPRGAGERILFVDDESSLADIGKQILDRLGYAADTCSNAHQAIDLVTANPAAYALIITDQMLPGMRGTDLAQRLTAIRSTLPVILTTGCTDTMLPDRLGAVGIQRLLTKPFSVQSLAVAVHEVLSTNVSQKI